MATAPPLPVVPVEEYLNSGYHPEMEYVDGVLVERDVPTIPHALLQRLLIVYFAQFEKSFNFLALPEVRTQIIERARYRVPDILLCGKPVPRGKVVNTIPLAVIEILSPEDRISVMLERFHDYASIGVPQIVMMDPERFIAHRYEDGSLIRTEFDSLSLPAGTTVPFSSQALFERLREDLA